MSDSDPNKARELPIILNKNKNCKNCKLEAYHYTMFLCQFQDLYYVID